MRCTIRIPGSGAVGVGGDPGGSGRHRHAGYRAGVHGKHILQPRCGIGRAAATADQPHPAERRGVSYRLVHQASMITSWAMPVSTA